MSEAYEYGEDEFDQDDFDEDDEVRMAILEAEANEVWLEEPGDEEEENEAPLNPLFGMFSREIPGIIPQQTEEKKENDENSGQ